MGAGYREFDHAPVSSLWTTPNGLGFCLLVSFTFICFGGKAMREGQPWAEQEVSMIRVHDVRIPNNNNNIKKNLDFYNSGDRGRRIAWVAE